MDWKVVKDKIQLKTHPNADSLDIGIISGYQVVTRKGVYKDGDVVVFVPEKSILPDAIIEEYFDRAHLKGADKNRVGNIRLRGEVSTGVTLPEAVAPDAPPGEDISELLGITKYEPPVPLGMQGEVEPLHINVTRHDVEQFGQYYDEFDPYEDVVISEKVHGSQAAYVLDAENNFYASSKGLLSKGLVIKESETNLYWKAAVNSDIKNKMLMVKNYISDWALLVGEDLYEVNSVQFFGEAIPAQGGNWEYGSKTPRVLLFDVRVKVGNQEETIEYDSLPQEIKDMWVPIIYKGKFSEANPYELAKGKEQVSGKELHIREGVVLRPARSRFAKDGRRLMVKIINPKYKEDWDELS